MTEELASEGPLEAAEESGSAVKAGGSTAWSGRWPGQPDLGEIVMGRFAGPWVSSLASAIEDAVIPRLLLSNRRASLLDARSDTPVSHASEQCVDELVQLLLTGDVEAAYAYIDAVRVRGGVPLAAIFLELLAPTARSLGTMWEEDRISFADVTVGLCRLHEVMRTLGAGQSVQVDAPPQGRRALLLPVPGEQHTFGLLMVADFFRRAGWDVSSECVTSVSEAVSLVRREWFTIVGFSVGCETHVEGLAAMIHRVRRAARNRSVGVMLGGSLVAANPGLGVQVGADAWAADARQAVAQADNLVGMLARPA